MPTFLVPLHEFNKCHNPEGNGGGQFCSGEGEGDVIAQVMRAFEQRQAAKAAATAADDAKGYTIKPGGHGEGAEVPVLASGGFTGDEYQQGLNAPLVLRPKGDASARLGTPSRWTAPNGVTVAYARNNADAPPVGFHQMEYYNEMAVPLTTDEGRARAALEAWATAHLGSKITTRWQARQLVRPGD